MIKTVIFDLDGTITEPFFDFDAIRVEIGMEPNGSTILEAMENMTPEQLERTNQILRVHEKRAVEQSKLNPTAKQTLQRLIDQNINIGILTRNIRHNVLAIADKHGLRFDAIIDRNDGPVKPDPFGVLELCRQFGTQPDECIVVGDFLYDLLSASNAGSVSVLLKSHAQADEFVEHADFTIGKLEEVFDVIEKCNG